VRKRGAKDKDNVGRRFFQRLEKCVEGGVRYHMRLVNDINLVSEFEWRIVDPFAKLANIVNPAVRRRVNLDEIRGAVLRNGNANLAGPAGVAIPARVAIDGFGEDASHGSLARASGTTEKVCVGNFALLDGVLEKLGNLLLPEDLRKCLRAILPV